MVDQSHQRPGVALTKRRPQRKIFGSHCHAPACGQSQVSKPGRVLAREEGTDIWLPLKKISNPPVTICREPPSGAPRITLQLGKDLFLDVNSSRLLAEARPSRPPRLPLSGTCYIVPPRV